MENKYKVKLIPERFISSLIFSLLAIFITSEGISGQKNDCPNGLVTFELMTGYVLTSPSDTITVLPGILHLTECMERCLSNNTCKSINFETGSCILLSSSATERPEALTSSQFPVFTSYAQKICITDKKKSCTHGWAFERVNGYELKRMEKKKVKVMTRLECIQLCLNELDFECRSVNYDSESNECSLSDMDRHTIDVNNDIVNKKFGTSKGTVDYIENNCIQEPTKFCDFRRINDRILKTFDSVYKDVHTITECREKCLNSPYHCHSFDFSDPSNSVCRISHLDKNSLTHIESPYLKVNGATTYELSMCYNVTITCRAREMVAKVKTSKLFNGKIYAKSKPSFCVNDISNSMEFDIKMQYNSDECDVKQSSPGHFTNDIVIQHHDMVVTTRDLALGVYCKFDLYNDSVSIVDLAIDGDILTDRLRGSAKLPDLTLHIVDINGADIDSVSLGDTLRVQVRMSDEATYGIFVRNLIAKDGVGGTNNLTLIDNTGCPVEAKMMREVRTISKERKSLESYLEAFTFTGSSTLELEAEVETCLDKCRPVQCQIITGRSDDDFETVTSYGRRKRRSIVNDVELAEKGDILSLTMLSKIVSIQPNKDVSKIEFPNNKKPSSPVNSPFRRSKSMLPKDSSSFRITLDEHGFYCFEPTTLATLSGVTLFVQGFMFTAALVMLSRLKDTKTMPIM